MNSAKYMVLSFLFAGFAHASNYTDFTGIWDGSCTGMPTKSIARTIVIMDSDSAITVDGKTYNLPEIRSEENSGDCGNFDQPATCTTRNKIAYSWNSDKNEVNLSQDWEILVESSPFKSGYERIRIRLAGNALEVSETGRNGNGTWNSVCTYPRRR